MPAGFSFVLKPAAAATEKWPPSSLLLGGAHERLCPVPVLFGLPFGTARLLPEAMRQAANVILAVSHGFP